MSVHLTVFSPDSESLTLLVGLLLHNIPGKDRLSPADITNATATMAVTLLYSSVQRPSAVAGLTLTELDRKKAVDGVWVLSVADHKTAAKGPARLSLDANDMQKLDAYVDKIRPHADPLQEHEKVLLLPGPKPITNVSHLTRKLEKHYNITVPTATELRKAVATSAAKSCDDSDISKLANAMSHSVETHKRYYTSFSTEKTAAETHHIVKNLTENKSDDNRTEQTKRPPLPKANRNPYTDTENEAIWRWFQHTITLGIKPPTLSECRTFLENFDNVHFRTAKNIQDKIRHLMSLQ